MEERVQNGRLEHTDDLCAERRRSWAAGREGVPRGGIMAIPFLEQMVGVLVPLIRKESGQERFSER